ncbi:MAG: translocation/assembly module TamB, partial [Chitinophagales bacterium]|nr:translocation/assembly module TamB [Chitinophagales bacterium]
MNTLSKIGNGFWILLGLIFILTGVIFARISDPVFQTYLAGKAVSFLSKKLKTEITVGSVNFSFFDHLIIHDLLIRDRANDTLVFAKTADATLEIFNLLQNRYVVERLELTDPKVYLRKNKSSKEFNFQFILDALQSKSSDSNSSPLIFDLKVLVMNQLHFRLQDEPNYTVFTFYIPGTTIDVEEMDVEHSVIRLKEILVEEADMKISKLLRKPEVSELIADSDTNVVHLNTKPLKLFVSKLHFANSQIRFDDEMKPVTPGRFDSFHQLYKNVNLEFSDGSLVNDTVQAKIDNISMVEKSGFKVNHLEAYVKLTPKYATADNLKVETANSSLESSLSLSYMNFHSFYNLYSSVALKAVFEKSSISVRDLLFFGPHLTWIKENRILTTGTLTGTLDNLKGKNIKLQTGTVTKFAGNIDVKGLPRIDETLIDFKVDQLITNTSDLFLFIPSAHFPRGFARLGNVNFNGSFTGFFSDFVAYGVLTTEIGVLRSDLNMKFNEVPGNATYSGNLAASQFDIGKYSGADSLLGTISFDAKLAGYGLTVTNVDATMEGNVSQLQFNGYNYKNIEVDGNFNKKLFSGKVALKDENVTVDFTGTVDLNNDLPLYNFHANIENANLQQLRFSKKYYKVATELDMNMEGDNIDNFIGFAKAVNTTFEKSGQQFTLDTLSLKIFEKDNLKHFLLASEAGTAAFTGKFALTKLPNSFLAVLDNYFPSLPYKNIIPDVVQDFDFDFALNDMRNILNFFFPSWEGMNESSVKGHFNSATNFIAFNGIIPSLRYKDLSIDTLNLNVTNSLGQLQLTANSAHITIGDSINIIQPSFNAEVMHDSAHINLFAANGPQNTYMKLNALIFGDTTGLAMHIYPSELVLNNGKWIVSENNMIRFADERLRFENFILSHDDQSLSIYNVNLRPRATNLHLDFNKIPIADLYHFVKLNKVDLNGSLSGSLEVLNVFHAPRLQANTTLDHILINGREISAAAIKMEYVPEKDQMKMELFVADDQYNLQANGSYYPRKAENQLNFNLELKQFDLSIFETLLPGYFSSTNGVASGMFSISGNRDAPLLTGEMLIPYLSTKIDYLQTTYHTFNEKITFHEDDIDLNKMKLFDENNDSADVQGQIHHDHLNHFHFNVALTTERIQALNTTQNDNELFYGRAEAGGLIEFLGPLENMEVRASISSKHGTAISVPIGSGTSVADRSFIQYKKKESDSLGYSYKSIEMIKGLQLNLDLDVTPDADIRIIFDQKAGDIIKGRGYGNIRMEINPKGAFNMYGTYNIEQGDYLFTMQNFFNKYFSIDRGGSISWTGDPYEANIDINAIYTTKASVYDLVVGSGISFTSDEEIRDLQRRIPVDVYLNLTGSLLQPDISFDIRLPEETTLSSSAYQQVQKVKQDEGELNKQVFGLLLLNRFLPTNSGTGNQNIGADVNNSVSEFLLNQLSYWTSQIRSDVDVNFNYQSYEANLNTTNPNDLTKRNELEVALTKRFFNDRLAVEAGGNFDFAATNGKGSAGNAGEGSSTNVAGDFSVEYKITPDGRLSGKAFSKSQYDVVDERYKTKNGVALSYKREFDKIRELFKKRANKQKRNQQRELENELKQNVPTSS